MLNSKSVATDITVVPATPQHADAIAALSAQLGYPASVTETAERLAVIARSNYDVVYVAVLEHHLVVGWMHVFYALRVEGPPFCEIGGMVVDEHWRSKGIGSVLVEHARLWSSTKGCAALRVRSNVVRKNAHQFYTREGFRQLKEQKVLELQHGIAATL